MRTEHGHLMGCPEPSLGRNEAEELAIWVRPIGYTGALRLRIVGLKALYDQASEKTGDRRGGHGVKGLV